MRVLVQNYATSSSTEPLYIHETLNALDGVESHLWQDNNVSVYDMFDITKPDVFITHFGLLTDDVVKYISKHKNIQMLINVTSAQQSQLDTIDSVLSEFGIKAPFLFTNQPMLLNKIIQRNTKLVSIMHGADLFLSRQEPKLPEYEIELGIVTDYKINNRLESLTSSFGTYHILTQNESLKEDVDILIPAFHMHEAYPKYKQVVVTSKDMDLPQAFFDAAFYGNSVVYHSKYDSQSVKMNTAIQSLLKTNESVSLTVDKIVGNKLNPESVRRSVATGHTCLHRVKRMLSMLKCSDLEKSLSQMIKEWQS